MGGLAPPALRDSVRPHRLAGAGARPLNFTVRAHMCRSAFSPSNAAEDAHEYRPA